MSRAEKQFKTIVEKLIDRGVYPGPTAINNARLGTHGAGQTNNINGRECRWRREVLLKKGFFYEDPLVSGRQRSWWKWGSAD
jgi:hypothetical protein